MRIRIRFRKNGDMRFVGHLDLLRYFQRALRRAGIDMAYSEGFSPHPILSFAAPLGLGLTSDGEYLDLEVHSTLSSCEEIDALNREMADGVEIVGYVRLREDAKKAMAAVAAADYLVYFKHSEDLSYDEIREGIRAYYTERDAIPVKKQTKKGERVIDVKPLLYRFQAYADNRGGEIPPSEYILSELEMREGMFLRLSAGSSENIRPELVIGDFYAFLGKPYHPANLQIHRLELYEAISPENVFVPLLAAGEEILCQERS